MEQKPSEGFSEALRHKAILLKARILGGEKIPVDELRAFILAGEKDLARDRIKARRAEKPQDVDFF